MKVRMKWVSDLAQQFFTLAAVPLTIVVGMMARSSDLAAQKAAGVDTPGHNAQCRVCNFDAEVVELQPTAVTTRERPRAPHPVGWRHPMGQASRPGRFGVGAATDPR